MSLLYLHRPWGLLWAVLSFVLLLAVSGCSFAASSSRSVAADFEAILLWIEESSTHLLPPLEPHPDVVSRVLTDDSQRLMWLDEQLMAGLLRGRAARRVAADDHPPVLLVHQVFDYDRLLGEQLRLIAAKQEPKLLSLEVRNLPRDARWQLRLLPRTVAVETTPTAGTAGSSAEISLSVDGQHISLAPGEVWSAIYLLGSPQPVYVGEAGWREAVAEALADGRPLTLLRVTHRGAWRVSTAGDDR